MPRRCDSVPADAGAGAAPRSPPVARDCATKPPAGGFVGGDDMGRTDWMCKDDCKVLLRLLTPANALAMEVAFSTGLRIGDVLALRTEQLAPRMSVRESKTGKRKRVYLGASLLERLRAQAGAVWVFPGALDPVGKHRTRQAVWKDVRRAAKAMRVPGVIGCHTARKVYAVDIYRKRGLSAAQAALGHDSPSVTLLYLASELIQG